MDTLINKEVLFAFRSGMCSDLNLVCWAKYIHTRICVYIYTHLHIICVHTHTHISCKPGLEKHPWSQHTPSRYRRLPRDRRALAMRESYFAASLGIGEQAKLRLRDLGFFFSQWSFTNYRSWHDSTVYHDARSSGASLFGDVLGTGSCGEFSHRSMFHSGAFLNPELEQIWSQP